MQSLIIPIQNYGRIFDRVIRQEKEIKATQIRKEEIYCFYFYNIYC